MMLSNSNQLPVCPYGLVYVNCLSMLNGQWLSGLEQLFVDAHGLWQLFIMAKWPIQTRPYTVHMEGGVIGCHQCITLHSGCTPASPDM